MAAEALAMSQKCVVNPTMTSISSSDFLPANADYSRLLRERYKETAFYQRLLKECSQFTDYERKTF